jgi:hypothetical protein
MITAREKTPDPNAINLATVSKGQSVLPAIPQQSASQLDHRQVMDDFFAYRTRIVLHLLSHASVRCTTTPQRVAERPSVC